MNTIRQILTGFFFNTLYKIGLVEDRKVLSVVGQRQIACNTCPLRDGNFCSKKKFVEITTSERVMSPLGFYEYAHKIVRGCSCYIPAKRWTISPCPLNRWEPFDTK